MSTPSIACIGVIGKYDNPLHIAIFPPYAPAASSESSKSDSKEQTLCDRNRLDFSFLLNASLDIFDARVRDRGRIDQDLGLLQHIDERLSLWGWLTGTGVKFVVIVDGWGRQGIPPGGQAFRPKDLERSATASSLKSDSTGGRKGKGGDAASGRTVGDADLKPAFKALQTAYIRLLQNPFYVPDEHHPAAVAQGRGRGGPITSKKFAQEVRRIGDTWKPGMNAL